MSEQVPEWYFKLKLQEELHVRWPWDSSLVWLLPLGKAGSFERLRVIDLEV